MQGDVRGKYVERYRAETNVVLLDPETIVLIVLIMQDLKMFMVSTHYVSKYWVAYKRH